jgi:hypothetical protein
MGNDAPMTLWRRIADGVWSCTAAVALCLLAYLLLSIDQPIIKSLGFLLWLASIGFGGIFFGIGMLIILGGVVTHARVALRRRHDA